MATTQELLDSVEAAILAIQSGAQSYTIGAQGGGTRTVQKADLGELWRRRTLLRAELATANGGGIVGNYYRRGAL